MLHVHRQEAHPDITIIVSDDQDEWFFENNMPALSVYWGESVPIIPRDLPDDAPECLKLLSAGYGDKAIDVHEYRHASVATSSIR